MTSTDELGRFEFTELTAADYTIAASAPGYVALGLGQRRPFDPRESVSLSRGQQINDVRLNLPKGGVIRGRVSDEFGQAVMGAAVRAAQIQYTRGRRHAVPIGNIARTDDLGQFRVYGLPTGSYLVFAQLPSAFAARRLDVTGYAPSYYPGTPVPEEATTVDVTVSGETPADLTLNPVRLSRVSGVAIASNGRAFSGGRVIAVRRIGEKEVPAGDMRSGIIAADGSFSVTGLPPGEYLLSAQQSQDTYEYPLDGTIDYAIAVVTVSGEDIVGLALTQHTSGTVRGRVVIDGDVPSDVVKALRIQTDNPDNRGDILLDPVPLKPDLTFEMHGLFGRQFFGVLGADALKLELMAVRFNGEDVTDKGLQFGLGQVREGLEVVLTTVMTGVSGTVVDERDKPTPAIVLAFAEDESRWSLPTGTFVRRAKAAADGGFKLEGLRPGAYSIVALDDFDMSTYGDPVVLRRLQSIAEPLEVVRGKTESRNLKLRRP